METRAASFAELAHSRILVAIRELRLRELRASGPNDPNDPTDPNSPQQPEPSPEIGEPRVFPIHPNIPTQPIHAPVREPDHTPTR